MPPEMCQRLVANMVRPAKNTGSGTKGLRRGFVELDEDVRSHLGQHLPGLARNVNCRVASGGMDWHQDKTFDARRATTTSALVYLNDAPHGFLAVAPAVQGVAEPPPPLGSLVPDVTTVPMRAGTLVVLEPGEWHAVPDEAGERYILGPFDLAQFGEVGGPQVCDSLTIGNYDREAQTLELIDSNNECFWGTPTGYTVLIFEDNTEVCVESLSSGDDAHTVKRMENSECGQDVQRVKVSLKNPFTRDEAASSDVIWPVVAATVGIAALGAVVAGWWLWRWRRRRNSALAN